MIFVPFGDSHSIFWGRQQSFDDPTSTVEDTPNLHWLGPAKIYGLDNHTSNLTKEKYKIFKNIISRDCDFIPISCFGEIDIRVNLAKIVLEQRDFSCISILVDLYLNKLNELPNHRIVIWGPPPSSMDSSGVMSYDYPVYGSGITRNAIIHLFNLAILKRINEYPKLRFITLFYDLVDTNLVTHPSALHDANHLSISHFYHARKLLDAVLREGGKASFNFVNLEKIPRINFFIQPLQQDNLSYVTNMLFSGPFQFQYFTNLKFFNASYEQSELSLAPGFCSLEIGKPAQIGNFAFLELFFQGNKKNDFIDFARFCSAFNGTIVDIFDAKDPWIDAFKAFLTSHENAMLRRSAVFYANADC